MARKRNGKNRRQNRPAPESWPDFSDIPGTDIIGRYRMTICAVRFGPRGDPDSERLRTSATASEVDDDGNKVGMISPRVIFNITTDIMRHCAVMATSTFDDAIDSLSHAAKAEGDPRAETNPLEALLLSSRVVETVRETLNNTILNVTKTQLDVGLPEQRAEFLAELLKRYCAKCGNIKIAGLTCACSQKA